jgi:threonyl-tRNA synthetase
MPETVATIHVTLPDGSVRDVPAGSTPKDIAAAIGPRLAKDALVARVDDELVDLNRPLHKSATLQILTAKSADALAVLRHSTAHATCAGGSGAVPRDEDRPGARHRERFLLRLRP